MNAAGWFALGAVSFGTVLGVALFVVLAGFIRQRAYEVCREQALLEFGVQPAERAGFNAAAPMQRHRSPDEQLVWRPVEPERAPRPVFDHPN